MLQLGSFTLGEPLARGGMGVVWSASHRDGTRVAVKVLEPRLDVEADLAEMLEAEVRSVAGLHHPHIIAVYDRGRVSTGAARASGGRLSEGSPWFAMEYADAGQLSWRKPMSWRAIRDALVALLDALAHAHARNVLHRDIKPANVLFSRSPTGLVLKLTDFGMGWSWLPTRSGQAERVGGTPQYMAPEQFSGDLALQGPWTDLYAVGCLAWALICGRPPYRGSWNELRASHRDGPFPALVPRIDVPEGLAEIVATLVSRPCGDRFLRAADVAHRLRELPEVVAPTPTGASHRVSLSIPGLPPSMSSRQASPTLVAVEDAEEEPAPLPRGTPPGPPPVVESWRTFPTRPSHLPSGVGLGLYGLRAIPLVDREHERDTLWRALVEVRTTRSPRLVVVRGSTGSGTSRLAEWLCEEAEEHGVAVTLRATHGTTGVREGVGGLVARHYRLPSDLGFDGTHHWLLRALSVEGLADPDEARRLTELASVHGRTMRTTAAERHKVVERLVRRAAGARAAVVWLDDAHADIEAIALAGRLARTPDLPVLVVMTVTEELLAAHRAAQVAVEALQSSPTTVVVRVGPLSAEHGQALVRELLGVSPELAAVIEERTAGHPLFAVQLVGDWVQRGRLVPGPDGFELADPSGSLDASLALPRSLTDLWGQRISLLLGGRERWRPSLLLGATLGNEVDLKEWGAVCAARRVPDPAPLVRRLLDLRLARMLPGESDRLVFVHRMLRETLFAQESRARVRELHLACAELLERQGLGERRGRHLLAAGQVDQAFRPLMDAVDARVQRGQPQAAEALLDLLQRSGGWSETDMRSVEIVTVRAQILRLLAHLSEAMPLAERAEHLSRGGDPRLRIMVLRELAMLLQFTTAGGPRLYQLLSEAQRLAEDHGFESQVPALLVQRGRAHEYHGRLGEARRDFVRALELLGPDASDTALGDVEVGLASVAAKLGDQEGALRYAEYASERFARSQLPFHQAFAETLIGEVLRARDDLEGAERAYRAVIGRYEALGAEHTALVRANLAIVLCSTGRFDEAIVECDRARTEAVDSGHANLVPMIDAFLAWATSGTGDETRFGEALAGAERLPSLSLFDPDLAMAADAASEGAARFGWTGGAARALSLARAIRKGLARTESSSEDDELGSRA
ncbi:MAG: protein kinase [Alphaproteobacteria bacterium]|nr:protein kinase [Alphaproteobacteria bacterium]